MFRSCEEGAKGVRSPDHFPPGFQLVKFDGKVDSGWVVCEAEG